MDHITTQWKFTGVMSSMKIEKVMIYLSIVFAWISNEVYTYDCYRSLYYNLHVGDYTDSINVPGTCV